MALIPAIVTYMKATANQPTRSMNSVTLSWGLLNIPCSLFNGTEATGFKRQEFTLYDAPNRATLNGPPVPTYAPVGRQSINKATGDVIGQESVVKMAQATNDTWVEVSDDEVAACTTDRGLASIVTFVPIKGLGEYETDGLYQVRAKRSKGVPDPAGDKALTLLFEAMRTRKVLALVTVSLRGPAKSALLDADGFLRFVVPADGIRQALDLPNATTTEPERKMALMLIDTLGKSTPLVTDETAKAIQAFVDAKAGGAPIKVLAAPPALSPDIMSLLSASIEAHKQ